MKRLVPLQISFCAVLLSFHIFSFIRKIAAISIVDIAVLLAEGAS
jgi:hypothetical protein